MTYLPTIRANLLKSQKYTVYLYSKSTTQEVNHVFKPLYKLNTT